MLDQTIKAITGLIMKDVDSPYLVLREKMYALKLARKRAIGEMVAFYNREIHNVEREIFALQEKMGY